MTKGTKKKAKVSVVCAWYNRADFIKDTVESLLNQNFDDYEIIIANDGSSDPRVKEILDSYNDTKLKVIHKENEGFTKTLRMLVDQAIGSYIAIQGAGDISYPDRLSRQYEYLKKNGDLISTGCWLESSLVQKDGMEITSGKYQPERNIFTTKDFLTGSNPYTHGEVMFVKEAYQISGGYRLFFKYAQDLDLWLRMSEIGDAGLVKEILYRRRGFVADGVSKSLSKQLLQKKLAVFARECAEERLKGNKDLVKEYAEYSLFYFKDNGSLKKFLCVNLIKSLILEDMNKAKRIIKELEFVSSNYGFLHIIAKFSLKCKVFRAFLRLFFKFKKFSQLVD